ncbi:hypothetical protein OIU74_009090 [Salix koriyanagi]|uniref:Uncharacterized protein n=1 Tax=Salix koriyanagi TaxID=2511006 RepID=A0A9Q0Z0D4_9ROSI|nr:hypothetical protein OIU74_009090 [Salix koriyanagi]
MTILVLSPFQVFRVAISAVTLFTAVDFSGVAARAGLDLDFLATDAAASFGGVSSFGLEVIGLTLWPGSDSDSDPDSDKD